MKTGIDMETGFLDGWCLQCRIGKSMIYQKLSMKGNDPEDIQKQKRKES